MTSREFCYWLQGHFEIGQAGYTLSEKQCQIIYEHLQYVFTKGDLSPKETFVVPQLSDLVKKYDPGLTVTC